MEYNRNVPWTTRLCSHTNDLFIRPFNEMKRDVDNAIVQKGILSKNQLDLVYSILAGVAIAAVYCLLPPPAGGIIALGIVGLEWAKPDLFSKRTWAVLQLGGGLYGIASTPRVLLLALKIDSGALAAIGVIRAAASIVLSATNLDYLVNHYVLKRDNEQEIDINLWNNIQGNPSDIVN